MPPQSVLLKTEKRLERQKLVWNSFLKQQQDECDSIIVDARLICDDGEVPVHAPILAEASSLFRKALKSQANNYVGLRTVILPEFKVRDIYMMVQLLYCGFVNLPSQKDIATLKEVLTIFQIVPKNLSIEMEPFDSSSILYYQDIRYTVIDENTPNEEEIMDYSTKEKTDSKCETEKQVLNLLDSLDSSGSMEDDESSPDSYKTALKVDTLQSKTNQSVVNLNDTLTSTGSKYQASTDANDQTSTETTDLTSTEAENETSTLAIDHSATKFPVSSSISSETISRKDNEIELESETTSSKTFVTEINPTNPENHDNIKTEEPGSQPPTDIQIINIKSTLEDKEIQPSQSDITKFPKPISTEELICTNGLEASVIIEPNVLNHSVPSTVSDVVTNSKETTIQKAKTSTSGTSTKVTRSFPITPMNLRKRPRMSRIEVSEESHQSSSSPSGRVTRSIVEVHNTRSKRGQSQMGVNSNSPSASPFPKMESRKRGRPPGRTSNGNTVMINSGDYLQQEVKHIRREYEVDVDDNFYKDSKRINLIARKCFVCGILHKDPKQATSCVLKKHNMVRCYLCFTITSTTDDLFKHYKKNHQVSGHESTIICPYFNCQEALSYKSISPHVIRQHLSAGQNEDGIKYPKVKKSVLLTDIPKKFTKLNGPLSSTRKRVIPSLLSSTLEVKGIKKSMGLTPKTKQVSAKKTSASPPRKRKILNKIGEYELVSEGNVEGTSGSPLSGEILITKNNPSGRGKVTYKMQTQQH